jgi:uncharacterized lipoprotein YddW (UPF0748 family)
MHCETLARRAVWCAIFIATAAQAQTIIIDNAHPGFSDPSAAWSVFDASGQWADDYRYTSTDDPPTSVEWRPELPAAGDYAVAVWYRSTGTSRPDDARYTVHHAGGATDVTVNQQINGSTWVDLGTFTFNAGTGGYVTLTSTAQAGKTIVADAVSFAGDGEWRAMWAYSWGSGFLTPLQTSSMINTLAAHNFNVIIPEVRKAGDAYYVSAYEPPATNLQPGYDALADMIVKAHAAGIEVHPWIVTYRIWNTGFPSPPPSHPYAAHPEWLMADTTGNTLNGSNYYLDPGVPRVQDYVVNVVMDIVDNYDVDGFNLDYIRYQGSDWGYNTISQQRFQAEFGAPPPTSSGAPLWETWGQWRRDQVTDLVRKIYVHIQASKPHVVLTADSITWGSLGDFTATDAYRSVFQDWRGWMQEGIVDAMLPMNYKDENSHGGQYRDWAQFAVENKGDRHAYIGQGCYINTLADSITQIEATRDLGADGHCQYQYQSTNDEGASDASFFATMASQVYTAPAATPAMPWKDNPNTGILAGTVTDAAQPNDPIYADWLYQVTVNLNGPESRTVTTDATGFYAFVNLPPGTYTVTFSKSGFVPQTVPGRAVTAGMVNMTDMALVSSTGGVPCDPVMLSDFEDHTPDAGFRVMFRNPGFSGSTSADLAATPDDVEVTDDVTAADGVGSLRVEWQWIDPDPQRWLRLTTFNAANIPNPTVDLRRPIRLRLRLDSGTLRCCIGLRETGTTAPLGADGGTSGDIEWVGASTADSGAPQGVLVTADPGVWQTLVFHPGTDPVLGMTGDGVLSSPTDRGVLEHVAFAIVGDAGPHLVYLDAIEQLCVPGDWDGDGDADLADFAAWDTCMTGPTGGPVTGACQVFDVDADQDVDLADSVWLQGLLSAAP